MLQVWLDRFVLLVELGEIRNDVLHDVGVGERVDLRFLRGVGWDTAFSTASLAFAPQPLSASPPENACPGKRRRGTRDIHKQARVLVPLMFIAQLPQIPSLQLRLKVKVGSSSFLIRISASSTMGPVLFRSRV